MKILLLVVFLVCSSAFCDEEPVMTYGKPEVSNRTKRMANRYRLEIKAGKLKERTNDALDSIIRLAHYKLNRIGEKEKAKKLITEWENQFKYELISRGITDHKPLSQWLAGVTAMLEQTLGHDTMHALRLDDLITINYAIPVIFRCIDDVDEIEFYLHFVDDNTHGYRGLGPVVAYWTTFFACVGFTYGSGFLYCSPIAMGVEFIAREAICPALNQPIWKLSCKK